jgi:glycosyltransferase involved in cell wall biosynthesis
MDLSGYDLVLSNKSGFCHGVRTEGPEHKATHVCYCLTPTRFLWQYDLYRQREQIGGFAGSALRPLLAGLRRWDLAAARRVDHFIAISTEVQARIRTIYGRESQIIYPPVDTTYFTPAFAGLSLEAARQRSSLAGMGGSLVDSIGDYYLVVSRLIPYKRIDLAVNAFRRIPGEKLLVVGDGRDLAALQAAAPPNVQFLGRRPRAEVRELLRGCRAFLFPGLEDFGIAPVEAMACGRPVIAFGGGGALDTVVPGVTGELFAEPTVESLAATLARFDWRAYDPGACRAQAERFSAANFRQQLRDYLDTTRQSPA